MRTWVRDPHSGGVKISDQLKRETERRIRHHAEQHYKSGFTRLDIKFRGTFCYIDAYKEPDDKSAPYPGSGETLEEYRERLRTSPWHLCRLRHCGQGEWSVAFYTYSHMKYEPAMFANGTFFGTPEEGLDIGAVYLQD
jgi:hypothetical protein